MRRIGAGIVAEKSATWRVGGVFFKSKGDSAALAAWYRKHLGMPLEVPGPHADSLPQ